MALDWIKMRTDLSSDPGVIDISIALGMEEDLVVGKLHRLWSWVTAHFAEAKLKPDSEATRAWIDRHVRAEGFVSALISVGWLVIENGWICIPNYDRHLSKGAKARALKVEQQRGRRSKKTEAKVKPEECFKVASREEKRREENISNTPLPPKGEDLVEKLELPENLKTPEFASAWKDWKQHRRERKPKLTPTAAKQSLADLAEWGPDRAVAAIRHSISKGWQGIFEPKQDHLPTPRPEPLSGIRAWGERHGVTANDEA